MQRAHLAALLVLLVFLAALPSIRADDSSTASTNSSSTTTPRPTKRINIVEQAPKASPATLPAYRTMKAKVAPANFSGPEGLRDLVGTCFHSFQATFAAE
jgi:hypothetical protein